MNTKDVSAINVLMGAVAAGPHIIQRIIRSTSAGSSHNPGDGSPLGEVMLTLSSLSGDVDVPAVASCLQKAPQTESIKLAHSTLFEAVRTLEVGRDRNFPRVASERWKELCVLLGVSPHTDEALQIVRQLKTSKESQ